MKTLFVSALYDIGREKSDGRTITNYKKWLKETLRVFPNMLVFHDGTLNSFDFPKNAISVILPFEQLWITNHEKLIEELCREQSKQNNDLTFQISRYGMLQISKFEFLERAKKITECDSMLWVDAGISRFLKKTKCNYADQIGARLSSRGIELCLELDLARNIRLSELKIKAPAVGLSHKVIGGGCFWVNAKCSDSLFAYARRETQNWLNQSSWDNEQVLLREMAKTWNFRVKYVASLRNSTASVAKVFCGQRRVSTRFDQVWAAMLRA